MTTFPFMGINSTYDHISGLIRTENYKLIEKVIELQYLASPSNVILTVMDKTGVRFNAEVYLDSTGEQISPPLPPVLDILPLTILHETVINMNLNDILNLCLTNGELNRSICGNDLFWMRKYIHDFNPSLDRITITDWKKIYFDIAIERHANEYIYPLSEFKEKHPERFNEKEYPDAVEDFDGVDITDLVLDDFKERGITLKKGDLLYPNKFNIYRNESLLIFDGEKVIDLEYDIDDYGGLPRSLKILEEPDYFPPQYWHQFPWGEDEKWRGMSHNWIIHFDHVPYRKELIDNIEYGKKFITINGIDRGVDGDVYTKFVDSRGITRYIIYEPEPEPESESESESESELIPFNTHLIRKRFEDSLRNHDQLIFQVASPDEFEVIEHNDVNFIFTGGHNL